MEKFLQKLLAAFVAGVIVTSATSVLAEKNGNTEPAKTTTAATEQTTVLSPEDLCLPEEYISYLNQNHIQIVDGNIVLETAEQFGAIAQYYFEYLKSMDVRTEEGVEPNLRDVCDHMLGLNQAFINDDVKRELANNEMITYPLIDYAKQKRLRRALFDHLAVLSKNETSKGFCSNTFIMFDFKIRKCIALEESYYITFLDTKKVGKNEKNPQYIMNFLNFYNFLIGEESSFPYKISDLDKSSLYVFCIINIGEQAAAVCNSKPPLMDIAGYAADQKAYDKAIESINFYIQNFPIMDE